MARFNSKQRGSFERIRHLCYQGLSSSVFRERLARELDRALGLDAWCLMELDADASMPVHAVSHGWSQAAHDELVERVLLVSPVTELARHWRQGRRVFRAAQAAPDGRRDAYFRHHLFPYGYGRELLALCGVRGAASPSALLTLTRRRQRGDFEPWHERLLACVAPHVALAMASAARDEGDVASLGGRLCIDIDDDGRAVNAVEPSVCRWLEHAAAGRGDWLLGVALLLKSQERSGDVPALSLRAPGSGVWHRCRRVERPDGGRRLVIEALVPHAQPSALRHLGLSPREAEVTQRLLAGRSTRDIATALGCAPTTVRVHLHRAFDKLGVSSRRELGLLLVTRAAARRAAAFTDQGPRAG
ncbi:MAG: helix-turn-helix transcriptional regulator [Myxococcales bacterium]|nr:helix-turn-helix transcriptional regulator [Myxococcales bacterium]